MKKIQTLYDTSSFVIAHARVVCRMRFVFNHMYFHRMVSASDGGLLGQMILPATRPPLQTLSTAVGCV